MPEYIYLEYQDLPLQDRFSAPGITAAHTWQKYIRWLEQILTPQEISPAEINIQEQIRIELDELFGAQPETQPFQRPLDEQILFLLLTRLQRTDKTVTNTSTTNTCPCVFISHRHNDTAYALRVAKLAAQNGFDYWVDIFDPSLQWLNKNISITDQQRALLTACIIEMAILNSTHVIACITPNSKGSLWIPYEYGRITEIPGLYRRSCAWRHPDLIAADYPDYMLLGVTVTSESEIIAWLKSEKKHFTGSGCGKNGLNKDEEPDSLIDLDMRLKEDIIPLPTIKFKPQPAPPPAKNQ